VSHSFYLKTKIIFFPLQANQKILVAGSGADNIAKQSGGWSVTWQGRETSNGDFLVVAQFIKV
jgi:beta-glucosidase